MPLRQGSGFAPRLQRWGVGAPADYMMASAMLIIKWCGKVRHSDSKSLSSRRHSLTICTTAASCAQDLAVKGIKALHQHRLSTLVRHPPCAANNMMPAQDAGVRPANQGPAMPRIEQSTLAENKLFVGGAPPGCDEATLQAVR